MSCKTCTERAPTHVRAAAPPTVRAYDIWSMPNNGAREPTWMDRMAYRGLGTATTQGSPEVPPLFPIRAAFLGPMAPYTELQAGAEAKYPYRGREWPGQRQPLDMRLPCSMDPYERDLRATYPTANV